MRLTPEQLRPFGIDAVPLHFIDTAFVAFGVQPDRIGVAVSGGGDSMALLHMAHVWSGLCGVPIQAVTVNHGLRSEAVAEANMVADFCDALGVPHTTLQWDGKDAVGNVSAAARDARYALLQEWALKNGVGGVLLGHTADDVAETFLMRLGRKAGVDGLAAMQMSFRRDDILFARPLWQSTRAELRDYLGRHKLSWVDDPSNDDDRFERSKARKVMAALAPLGVTSDVLNAVACNMREASNALRHYAVEEAKRHVKIVSGDVVMPLRARPPVSPEIERRLIHAAVQYISGAGYPPRKGALVNLEDALLSQNRHTVGGCLVTKEGAMRRFSRELSACEGRVPWHNRTLGKIWDGRWLMTESSGSCVEGDLTIRALGDSLKDVPDWRAVGLPRSSLLATPAVFDGETLISAPVAGLQNGFEARIVADFHSFLLSR